MTGPNEYDWFEEEELDQEENRGKPTPNFNDDNNEFGESNP